MKKQYLADKLSRYALSLQYSALPSSTIHEVKRRVIDSLGCALGAFYEKPAVYSRTIASRVKTDEALAATLWGTTTKTTVDLAAFVNGIMTRYFDFNDTYLSKEPAHPSDNIAALFAVAEAERKSGKELIKSIAIAYEIQCRLCDAASIRKHFWDHVNYGNFSVTLGLAPLLGLTVEQACHAQGLAAAPHCAMRQTRAGTLSMWKGCAFANTSRNATFAALLAREGMTGPAPIFEGEMGFEVLLSHGKINLPKLGGVGKTPFMIDVTSIKYAPVEYHAQAGVQLGLQLRREIPNPDDIKDILIRTFDAAVDIIAGDPSKWNPTTRETADHSLPYCVAVAILDGQVWHEQFDEKRIRDPKILKFMKKIRVKRDAACNKKYPETIPTDIEVTLKNGKKIRKAMDAPPGHAKNPMTDKQVEDKFIALTEKKLTPEQQRATMDRLWKLDEISDVSELPSLFVLKNGWL
jgi:2-methylcitrate dehydratase